MSSLHNQPVPRAAAPPTLPGRPDWLLPVALCGGIPVALSLLASLVLFAIWASRGNGSPTPLPITAQHDASPSLAQPADDKMAKSGVTPSPAASGTSRESAVIPVYDRPLVLGLPLAVNKHPRASVTTAYQYAYDPNEGRLAILGPWRNAIGFIDLDEQDRSGRVKTITYLQLTGRPIAVAYEESAAGGRFAVGTKEPAGVVFLDSETMQVMRVLEGDPASVGLRAGNGPAALRGIDWDRVEISLSAPRREHQEIGSITVDASLVDPRDRHTALCIAPGKPYVAFQRGLYSRDDKRLLTKLAFSARTLVRDGTLVAGVTDQAVVIGSVNDGHILASVPFPEDVDGVAAHNANALGFVAHVFFDKGRDWVIAGLFQDIVVIPLQTLSLPNEPILHLSNAPPMLAYVETEYECSLETISGGSTATLLAGPQGMKVENGSVRWTPQQTYERPVDVKVMLVAGDLSREESWRVWVEECVLDVQPSDPE